MMTFGIALGSNLGDRLQHLRDAAHHLLHSPPSMRLIAAAPLYETDPVDCPPDSQAFYNTVAIVESDLEPIEMLRKLRAIEVVLGRPSEHGHHAPRTVDLDLLFADDAVLHHPDLILPHPRLHLRRFVLQPLAEVQPDRILPGQAQSVAELLSSLDSPEPPLRPVTREWIL